MSPANSKGEARPNKPKKPDGCPLFPHASGRWAKKVRGKFAYFGKWDDLDGALAKWETEKAALLAGRTPEAPTDAATVARLTARFLSVKEKARDAGELSARSYLDYKRVADTLIDTFGKKRLVADLRPRDFEKLRAKIAKKNGPVRLGNEIVRVRGIFKYAVKVKLIANPVDYGDSFSRPSQRTLRLHRHASGGKMFEAAEVRKLLAAATQPIRTMILLGLNCGFGNSDVGALPIGSLDLDRGWIDFPRPKTGTMRRCPLWPETVEALRQWLTVRPEPKKPADGSLVFLTKYGHAWKKDTPDSPVAKEFRKLLDEVGIGTGKRTGFYNLRHVFLTVAEETKDFVAVRAIMGHVGSEIATVYRERIGDDRLRAVTEHVRNWLAIDASPSA